MVSFVFPTYIDQPTRLTCSLLQLIANVRRKSTFQNPNLNDRSLWSRLFHKKNGSDRKIHCDSNIIVSPKSQKGVGGTPLPTSAETTEVVEFSRPKARSKFFDLEKGKPNRADSEETVSVSLRPRLPADGQSDVLCDLEDISETHRAI